MSKREESEMASDVEGRAIAYELEGATRWYGDGAARVAALDSLSLTIASGEFVAVLGPSGSGKSTLLQLMGALDDPSSGTVRFEQRLLGGLSEPELAALRLSAIGFVFQQFNLIPTLTAAENVEVALAPLRTDRGQRRKLALGQLDAVGLASRAEHLPGQLSGGEQQRAGIARALARAPRVILGDEPTGNLDARNGEMVIDLLEALHRELGITLVLVTHDHAVAERADRVLGLEDGRLVSDSGLGDRLEVRG